VLLQHTANGWVARDLDRGNAVRIEEPLAEDQNFSSCCPPGWSRDGRYAAFIEHYRPTAVWNGVEPTLTAGVPVINMENAPSTLARWSSRITIVDRANGFGVQRILLNDSALNLEWDSDNSLLVAKSNLILGDPSTAVARLQPNSQGVENIYRTPGRFQAMKPAAQPGGDMIALVLDVDNRTWDDFTSILLIDANTGEEMRRLTHDLPIKGKDYVWSVDGNEIYARVGHGGLEQIYAIPLRGRPRQLTCGMRRHFNMELSPNGRRLSYQTRDGYGRNDIRILDLNTGVEKIVLVLDDPAKDFRLGKWQHVRWDSTDAVEPFGYLITPPDFNSNRQYPMIVDVHSGGEGSRLYLNAPLTLGVASGPLEWHAWAALGYVVFVPDYRSTGDYGPEVIAARYRVGEFGAIKDIEDIVSGTRFVTSQGFVDPSRIAILGHSAGGQRVYILLTRHDLYAAAILNEAISPDPVSIFIKLASGANAGGYPAGVYRQMYGGELSEYPDRYKVNYMFDSYRIKTPTLIMLGNEKLGGIHHMPNEILYSILKQHDVPTRLLKFVEEGHTYSRPESAKLAFEEVRHWLGTHMPTR
jgi:dipeptidyl aminopeptidase/acylaminoacyl peptidase